MLSSIKRSLVPGNVNRKTWPGKNDKHINFYLGNGRCGACFDAYGLMHNGMYGEPLRSISNTTFMHADHWHRGAYGLDYWLPMARLIWAGEPPTPPVGYEQRLDLFDAILTTTMTWPSLQLTFRTWFHPTERDLWAVEVEYEAVGDHDMPSLMLTPETELKVHYKQHISGSGVSLEQGSNWWLGRIQAGSADSLLGLRILTEVGECSLVPQGRGMGVEFRGGRGAHLLLFGAAATSRKEQLCQTMESITNAKVIAAQAREGWHKRWGASNIMVPDERYQAMWARSAYYMLASYAPEVRSPAPPAEWSGNGWPFHFPQDLSFIHPALLRLGHLDIARSWVEYYSSCIAEMREFTKRVFAKPGVMWAWVFPIGHETKLLAEGAPNWCHYEIHNVAYPARMAYETARYLRDAEWARDVAWPVVRESALFCQSILQLEANGELGIHVKPSMGQDERGGKDATNYLCALFSTQYTLRIACAMASELGLVCPEADMWRQLLQTGLAFGRLFDINNGYYLTAEGLHGKTQLGKQKHPVQLNPITFLPMGQPDQPTLQAYQQRYDLCVGVADLNYAGWTLAAYWLAASHMGDAAALVADLDRSIAADYVDADFLQIYESSHAHHIPFYVTSHGLYLQALQDALVSDYWGTTKIGAACPAAWEEASFSELYTAADGQVFSGVKTAGGWSVQASGGGGGRCVK